MRFIRGREPGIARLFQDRNVDLGANAIQVL